MLIKEEIKKLKKEKNAVILAHYYVSDEIQEAADYVGDSYYLSKVAAGVPQEIIVFCGVYFMGESAKILNPQKKVLMPDLSADCAMAHMVTVEKIEKMRKEYHDLAVVCYINSTAEIKSHSDVCVTSSNAIKIVKTLKNKNIFFVPDGNLGRFVAEKVPDKNIIVNDGCCPVHALITKDDVLRAKRSHPGALFLAHPECFTDVLKEAAFIGSTSEIIRYAAESREREFIIGTETGVFYELGKTSPDKKFYTVNNNQKCGDMKLITLEKVRDVLLNESNEVRISKKIAEKASKPLERMLELAK